MIGSVFVKAVGRRSRVIDVTAKALRASRLDSMLTYADVCLPACTLLRSSGYFALLDPPFCSDDQRATARPARAEIEYDKTSNYLYAYLSRK